MYTPSHVIYSIAGFRRIIKTPIELRLAAFGGLLPDIPNYIFAFYFGLINRTDSGLVWDVYYYSSWYQPIANHFKQLKIGVVLWGLLLLASLLVRIIVFYEG